MVHSRKIRIGHAPLATLARIANDVAKATVGVTLVFAGGLSTLSSDTAHASDTTVSAKTIARAVADFAPTAETPLLSGHAMARLVNSVAPTAESVQRMLRQARTVNDSAPVTLGLTGSITTGGSAFTLKVTKPIDTNTGAGVVRPAPTTALPSNALTNASTAVATYVGQHFTADLQVTAANVSFIDCYFSGSVTCKSSGAIFSNCVIRGNSAATNHWLIMTTAGTGTYLEFCDIYPTTPTDGGNAIGERNYELYRCKLYNTVDGFSVYAANGTTNVNVTVQGCVIPRLAQFRPDPLNSRPETHNDGAQMQGGIGGTFIGNNFMAQNSTDAGTQPPYQPQINMSCIMITPNTGHVTNLIITDNWFDYGIIAVNGTAMTAGDSVTLKRNKFGAHITFPNTTRPIGLDASASNTIGTGADANVWEVTWSGGTAGQPVPIFYS